MDAKGLKVGLFTPCVMDQFMVASAEKTLHLLEEQGVECLLPQGMTCCGAALFAQGDIEGAKELGSRMMEAYRGCDYVVIPSSGCAAYVRRQFSHLFAHSALYSEGVQLASKCFELSDFLVSILHYRPTGAFPHRVAWVDQGRARRDYGLHQQPRQLLQGLQGLELVEAGELDTDLLFASQNPDAALSLLAPVVSQAREAGAQYLATADPTLLLQLRGYCSKQGLDIKCRHLVDLLTA